MTKKETATCDGLKRTIDVLFHPALLNAIFSLAKSEKLEWTLMGHLKQDVSGSLVIDDVIVPYQENTGATTEIPNKATLDDVEFDPTYEWRTRDIEGVEADPKKMRASEWNVCIHSHNSMSAFWSGTDITELKDTMAERNKPFVAIVVNERREYECVVGIPALDVYVDGKIYTEEMSLRNYMNLTPDKQKEISDEYLRYETLEMQLPEDIKKYTIKKEYVSTYPAYKPASKWERGQRSLYDDNFDYEDYYGAPSVGSDVVPSHSISSSPADSTDMCLLLNPTFEKLVLRKPKYKTFLSGYYVCDPKTLVPDKRINAPISHLENIVDGKEIVAYCEGGVGPVSIYWSIYRPNDIPLFLKKFIDAENFTN